MRYVTLNKFEEMCGYTKRAIESKISKGVWLEDKQYRKAPDGRILVDVEGVQKWIEGEVHYDN